MKDSLLKKSIRYIAARGGLNYIPDIIYLKLLYWARLGKKLSLNNPRTFNEKLQWLKLHERNPVMIKLTDKYEVRKYIKEIIGEEYLVPLLGVYDKESEIDFDKLPEQFVLKCTHDSGGVFICKNKNEMDIDKTKKALSLSLKRNFFYWGREWPYKSIKPRIIIEEYLKCDNLKDYKFMCFNGIPKCVLVCSNRNSKTGVVKEFYDLEWNKLPFGRTGYKNIKSLTKKPNQLEKMIQLSKKLARNMPFIRVDLYEVNDKIYFGELTFFPASGLERFEPEEWDEKLGKLIDLSRVEEFNKKE